MYQTIQLSSCVSAQGDVIEQLPNGDVVIRDGGNVYRGRPIASFVARQGLVGSGLRPVALARDDG
jgi:hypothetical protein